MALVVHHHLESIRYRWIGWSLVDEEVGREKSRVSWICVCVGAGRDYG